MKNILVRGIPTPIFEQIQKKSQETGLSVNKVLLECVKSVFGAGKVRERSDLDEFFGSWSEQEYQTFKKSLKGHEIIDPEVWE